VVSAAGRLDPWERSTVIVLQDDPGHVRVDLAPEFP
jgi:hypothetical protein